VWACHPERSEGSLHLQNKCEDSSLSRVAQNDFLLATVILLALVCGPAWAQAPSSARAANGEALLAQARKLYSEQGPKVALPEYERALAIFQKSADQRNEAITLGYIGNCHKRLGDLPKALEFLQRALALKQKLGDRLEEGKTLSHLGLVY
jgi:tetratricopeptide (TPR) repeat protein